MKEELLHFIWQSKLLLGKSLMTTEGQSISITHPGTSNRNAGPDFFNAKIKIGDTLWAGNVEIHVSASEWYTHAHQHDAAYNNVILHVVFNDDRTVLNANSQPMPTLELRSIVPSTLLQRYAALQQQSFKHIPCEKIISLPDESKMIVWLQRLLIERIERKCDHIQELLNYTRNDWEFCFYIITARYFGMKTNDQPFEQLAKSLHPNTLLRHKNNMDEIFALILGISGLLPRMGPEYQRLQPIFKHLQKKYELQVLNADMWKFSRTRPANFPTERLLQFAALVYTSSHLFSKVLDCETAHDLKKLYDHKLDFGTKKISMGEESVYLLLINSVLPFVFWFGKHQHKEELSERALLWYEQLPAEKNAITRQFTSLGLTAKNAADGQAYIQLKNEYCTSYKCLNCSIGYQSLLHA
jgi:hypothetical protein